MWEFILNAGTNLDLYGRNKERALIDTTTMGMLLYYTIDGTVLITSGVMVRKGVNIAK